MVEYHHRFCADFGEIFTHYRSHRYRGITCRKKYIPEGNGTLKTDTSTFGLMVFAVIAIIAALAFFPALTLNIGALNSEQKELVEYIKDDVDRLLKITGELLNLTQVESGNFQLSQEPADSKELVRRAIEATKTQAEQKKMNVEATLPDHVSKVLADAEKTVSVLINLISNAIRYSYEGGTVEMMVSEEEDHVKFVIKDHGSGIPDKYLPKVFDRYFRVPGTQREGTGLGLAISKEFIEAQGGSLGVESEFGSGSPFCFTLKNDTGLAPLHRTGKYGAVF